MKRRTVERERHIVAFRFGLDKAKGALRGVQDAMDSSIKRAELWNALTAVEAERRERYESILELDVSAILARDVPEFDTLTKKQQDTARRRARKEAREIPANAAAIAQLNAEFTPRKKEVIRLSPCYTWQKDELIPAFYAACGTAAGPSRHPLRRYEGSCALRWQTGLPIAEVFAGTDLRLQLLPYEREHRGPSAPDPTSRRSQQRSWRWLRFRVNSADRKPVWFEGPICLHRPLPEDGLLRKANLTWRRTGAHVEFSVSLTFEVPGTVRATVNTEKVAVDLCWRRRGGGILRVGYLRDERDHILEIRLTSDWCGEFERCEKIQSYRDNTLNLVMAELRDWMKQHEFPEWMRERTSHIHMWKSQSRLARLVREWQKNRFVGDEVIYPYLEEWRVRDKHLWEFEAHLRRQLCLQRREYYRDRAKKIAAIYGELILEEFNLAKVARRRKNGDGTEESAEAAVPKSETKEQKKAREALKRQQDAARHQRVMAAPFEFRNALKQAFARTGGTVTFYPAMNTTMRCSVCGYLESDVEFNKARELRHACVSCGAVYDQDDRACQNLLLMANNPEWREKMGKKE